jgi:YD repeat-containing protein
VAVGDAVAKDGTDHAVMWDASGQITDLGLPTGSRTAQATGMLPGGVVVGTAQVPAPGGGVVTQAIRWPAAGQPQMIDGQRTVVANADSGQDAVGYRTDAKGGRHPIMWRCGR